MLEKFIPELASGDNAELRHSLEAMISERKLAHAMIIEGDDAELCGRVARLCARGFLCTCETPLDGSCRSCRLIEAYGGHADVITVEGGGKTGAVTVDRVRELIGSASLVPADGQGQVYLLENCDNMLAPAQNAFLKLFEEPPVGVMFIMTCRSSQKLLETVRSRAYLLRVRGEKAAPNEADVELFAFAERFAVALASESDKEAMLLTGRFCRAPAKNPDTRKELARLFVMLERIFREALVIGAGAGGIIPESCEAAKALSRTLPPERVGAMLGTLPELAAANRSNAPISLMTSAICVRLRRAAGR